MFHHIELIGIVLGYVCVLFGIAQLAERASSRGKSWANNPIVYSLALAVYCTTWTFYGSVGKAAKDGMLWLTIYLGPTIAMALAPWFLERAVRVKSSLRVTSIADFISARYGKSQGVAAVVTLMLLVGIVPYIALQLRAVTGTFDLLTSTGKTSSAGIISPIVIASMFCFTVIFGIRRLDPTERHPGMMVSLSVESLVKLLAFLAAGVFVTYSVFGGLDGFFTQLDHRLRDTSNYMVVESTADVINYLTYLLLATAAFMFLPRQFHVSVVENSNPKHVRTAAWLVPVYLVAINVFVLPIALGGMLTTPNGAPDQFVLALPMIGHQHALTAIVFLGGFSAAVGMLMVETMTMSTMVSNHLILPLLESHPRLWSFRRHLLGTRWFAAALLILASYGFEVSVGHSVMLVNMGMLSFAAVTQFAPAMVGALYWRKASRGGALLGLAAGFGTWTYTLLLPALIRSGWLPESLLMEGPAGIAWLKPESMFGLVGLSGLAHGTLWSLLFNAIAFVLGTALFPAGAEELRAAEEFSGHRATTVNHGNDPADIPLAEKLPILEDLVRRYHTPAAAAELVRAAVEQARLTGKVLITISELSELHQAVERLLAGAIGAAAAHTAMDDVRTHATAQESAAMAKVYAGILAGLNMAPSELRRRVDYHQEKEALLRAQAAELKGKMELLDREVDERRKAERALQELNEQLEGRVAERTRALKEAQRKIIDAAHQAGRAEIATSILHNVGNVLNSVNVSLSTISETLSRSRAPLLEKTAALLAAHRDDMHAFLTADEKGKLVPAFVVAVSATLKEERDKLHKEVELLTKNIEHIKVIISVQQSHAKSSLLMEQVDVDELINDATSVNAAGLDQARVRVVHENEKLPLVTVEKHKVLQVLVNLISNAKHAMAATLERERVLTLTRRVVENGTMVEICVTDTGVGIPQESLCKVFQHGFTTRSDGHGFGLHGSAIAATQMHGSLTASSDGPGRGATFTLRIPVRPPSNVKPFQEDLDDASGVTVRRGERASA